MVEEYNDYGEIIKHKEKPVIFERKLNSHQQHRIHETKDLFEGDCFLCQKAMDKGVKSYWSDDA